MDPLDWLARGSRGGGCRGWGKLLVWPFREPSVWPHGDLSEWPRRELLSMIFGRTDLRIGVSGAKFDGRADLEVHLPIASQKPLQNCCEKLLSGSKVSPANFFFVEK